MTKAIYVAGDVQPGRTPQRREPLPRNDALRRLVDQGVLSATQADAVAEALRVAQPERPRNHVPWAEVAGYLGGGLVLAGALVLVASSWGRLTETARTGLVAAFTLVLMVAAVAAAGGLSGLAWARPDAQTPRLRVAGALLALAAVTTAATVGVAMPDAAGSGGDAIAAGIGLIAAACGYAVLPTAFGLIASIGLGVATVMSTVNATIGDTPLYVGLALTASGALVVGLALGRVFRHRLLGLGVGAGLALYGAQQPLGQEGAEPWAYLLTLGLGLGYLVLYQQVRLAMLLVFGVIGVTVAVPEAIWDLTDGAVRGAAVLVIAGAVLLAASGLGFRMHRRRG